MSAGYKYHVIITGNIGAGKSTLLGEIQKALRKQGIDYGFVPEYIDHPEFKDVGNQLLKKWHDKKVSSFFFETFILEYYRYALGEVRPGSVILMERSPMEITQIFLERKEACWKNIDLQALEICKNYCLPPYCKILITRVGVLSLAELSNLVSRTIVSDLCRPAGESVATRIFYLDVPPTECMKRIRQRKRESEASIEIDYLQLLQQNYEKYLYLLTTRFGAKIDEQ